MMHNHLGENYPLFQSDLLYKSEVRDAKVGFVECNYRKMGEALDAILEK